MASLTTRSPVLSEALGKTPLVMPLDVATGSREDFYGLTYAVIYATDFGNQRIDHAVSGDHVLGLATGAVAAVLDDDDFDVAAELLLAWPLLDASWSAIASFVFGVLCRVQDDVGALPSLAIDKREFERQPAASKKGYVTAVSYHTEYVMGLLCATILRIDNWPSTPISDNPDLAGYAMTLMQRILADGRSPQWQSDAQKLSPDALRACAPFLVDVALVRISPSSASILREFGAS